MRTWSVYIVASYRQDGEGLALIRTSRAAAGAEAVAAARAMVPTVAGAAAVALTVDSWGKVWTTTVLGTFGKVPDGFADRYGEVRYQDP